MPKQFGRWFRNDTPDLAAAKGKTLQYTENGKSSRKAFWVFAWEEKYRPPDGLIKGRVLVVLEFDPSSESKIFDPSKWIWTEDTFNKGDLSFIGEAQHPDKIIVKKNELGAYGIGQDILRELNIISARLASDKELINALSIPGNKMSERELPGWKRNNPQQWW